MGLDEEKQASESRTPSIETSSTANGIETPDVRDEDANRDEEKAAIEAEKPLEYPKGLEMFFIMLALVLSITLCSLDQTIVATAVPKITDQFGRLQDISWYGSAYFLTLGAFQSLWGKIYKFFPLKTSFLASIFIFELGSLISAVARNSMTVIVGRAIAGLGASGVAPGVYTIPAFIAAPEKRATYTGFIGLSYGIAAVAGPLIGGGLTDGASWRWCFYINLPIGGLAILVILLTFKTPAGVKVVDATLKEKLLQMDFIGTALVMGASLSLLLALQYGGVTHAWNSSVIIGLLVGFVLMIVTLIAVELWLGERAMLTPRLIRQRTVWVNAVWSFFFAGSYFITLYYLPIYFQSIDNQSPIGSGVRNIPLIALFSVATFASGKAITKTGTAAPYLVVSSIIVTIASGLFYTLDIGTSTGKWVGYQILAGFGYGVGLQVPVVISQAFAAPSDMAPVTSIIIFSRTIGGTFLITAAQSGFINQIIHKLSSTAPTIDPDLVTETGATTLRHNFSGAELNGILHAYVWGIKVAFAITIAACGITVITSLCTKWTNIHLKKQSS
ncbi:related to major facilitator (MFS1) transporter [Fusarium fujikuroi IMI 58289]|uniref:Related to major facilitator (MFS1) transporter n=1 Tax=Gibberella fujikuroi (strain CBS 195.34 / IMI 58289 / NRRL A-6831) TaxID=1279085 RepID=S0ECH6_GIBF5|nr:related to major facilitator (MFS1) transporter [Fusarium fujikuroi IMI 58289]KLO95094.1 major facilitator (MFS1) transporter [Fusarium fujikuroi]CCT72579.1 related to major facilitator (MFS1) transporter [Fusarium fujikuroi IMI 58289]SCO12876.1 related to major facilitator (MFS1) transporter [Fusarium fujikuroi]SCO22971.1 related to major facilitator (MFS1) transporter [Fusarium fujikuroi]SCO54711.1 related to major facilitator (MFS1) transporter [Fusarium fujikuroi]